ncbi:tRNA (uracil(54)-C(5))-methyltransferase-like protein [Hypsibius exemplaris]|uniref:tRNA (uracil(54)-C(5))-methyltransferase n=1 Tax=Hypsibius exemplaris TaxID=2072580 RepID=A0A1W0WLB8_HYPEX|nr:tRNA (uracil(54)-C(5))-methyltransferase-like protein [Hypsibius exemplaris]
MSMGAGFRHSHFPLCLPQFIRHARRTVASQSQSSARPPTAPSVRNPHLRRKSFQKPALPLLGGSDSSLSESSQELVKTDRGEITSVEAEDDDGSFTAFRGIMARAGVTLPLGLGNHFKPDPFLRLQITAENQDEVLAATMTPLAALSYPDQLRFKWERNRQLLRNFSRSVEKKVAVELDENGLICPLEPVVPSPVLTHFRNKDELNVSSSVDGYKGAVGFFIGRSRDNNIICVRPKSLVNMKEIHKHLGRRFEEFIESSQYGGCHLEPTGFVGHWKGITARSNRQGDLMAVVAMHPQTLSLEELTAEKKRLSEFFSSGPGKDCNLKSLYFQACPHSQCSPIQYPMELLFGADGIIESIGRMKFRISPSAFFQINTDAAEQLYLKIAELTKPTPDTILLDVCCGTGTIGLFMASKVDQVIGIEKNVLAIADAEHNMGLNNVPNATYFCDTAEKAIKRILKDKQYNYSTVSAVVNPGRSGLDLKVINALREAPQVNRVVYVSCLPVANAMRNLIDLCLPTSKHLPGEPFYPTRAIPVDMFPNTDHCELLILFERNRLFFA